MHKTIKLIALDIDGTILRNDHTIHPENITAIQKAVANGLTVVLSTGRSLIACEHYAEQLELRDLIVTGNGSEVWRLPDQVLHRVPLNPERVSYMWELKQRYDTYNWAATTEEVYKLTMPERIDQHTWLKFGFDTKDDEARKAIIKALHACDDLEVTNSSETNIEVNAAGVNKAGALEIVSSETGIAMDEMIAMGDSLNDVSMIKACGIGVAMGNAQEITKNAADHVTATNEQAGVAKAFRHFGLI